MKKTLLKHSTDLFHYVNGIKVVGAHAGLYGDFSGTRGDCSDLHGDCSGLRDNCTDLWGDCTGVNGSGTDMWGDLSSCELTDADRAAGVNITDLISD